MSFAKHWRLIAATALVTVYALTLWKAPQPEPGMFSDAFDFGYEPDPAGAAEFLESLDVRFFLRRCT